MTFSLQLLGARLQIYNIADPAQPNQQVGSFPLNSVASDLAVQDQMVYLVDRDGHLLVFHAPDPETMYVIAAFQNAGNSRLFVHGDWGFTTNDVCVNGSCKSELKLFSLQSLAESHPLPEEGAYGPDLPVVSILEVPMAVVNVFSDGEYAYIAHQNGVLVAALPDLTVTGQLSSEFANGAVYQRRTSTRLVGDFCRLLTYQSGKSALDRTAKRRCLPQCWCYFSH
jgi:hypothetical protein